MFVEFYEKVRKKQKLSISKGETIFTAAIVLKNNIVLTNNRGRASFHPYEIRLSNSQKNIKTQVYEISPKFASFKY